MKTKLSLLAFALLVIVSVGVLPMMAATGLASVGHPAQPLSCSGSPGTLEAPIDHGGQCIPCSPNRPCQNPLTVCSYNGNANHGCCLGYAG
jgi:hypothetical protein